MATKDKELTTQQHPLSVPGNEAPQLPVIPDPKEFETMIRDALEGFVPSFEVIKIPTGGSLVWSIPGSEEPIMAKEFQGVIIDHFPTRVYWPGDYEGGNSPPDCSSLDARTGTKYGQCKECEFSQWGSGKEERGQACKLVHRVYVLLANSESIFPFLIPFPPTSAPERGGYEGCLPTYLVNKILGRLKKPSEVWTKFRLIEGINPKKIKYSKVACFLGADLTETEKKTAAFLKQHLKTAMREKSFETAEYETGKNGEETRGAEHREPQVARESQLRADMREADRQEAAGTLGQGGKDPWDK